MSQINTTRDAGTGRGTVWDIQGAPGSAAPGHAAARPVAAFTFTSATWSAPAGVALRRDETEEDAVPERAPSLLDRVMERKVAQWTAAYLAGAWLTLQLMDVLADIWDLSVVVQQIVSLVLGLGVMPALVVAWYHGEKGRQEVCSAECTLIAASIMASMAAIWMFCLTAVS